MSTKPQSTLQVFAGNAIRKGSGKQSHTLVAAESGAKAIEALHGHDITVSASYFEGFWSITNDAEKIALAISQPGRVFSSSGRDKIDYQPIPLPSKTGDN